MNTVKYIIIMKYVALHVTFICNVFLYIYMYIYRKDVRKIQLSIYFEIDVYMLKEENKFGQG